ncbi:MFS transporter [Paraburkholderia youngii]|uniref:MFS transporter n=1 Tax=Paraburkholderia youngii TaxID=2782701 RepID=A0ABX2NJX9_9BURK|nr:MFS transporter [Paraburkholderia youngii]NVI04548.1 MFS transporter [Paraburkholderia youngii]
MTDGLPNPQRAFAYLAIAIAMTMSVLDTSIVNVALPTISNDLAVSPANAIWVVNAYQLAITVSLLPLAVLGDGLGYKRVYCYGLVLFTLASFACANAHTLLVLAVARVFQGFGAGGIMSVSIALVRFVFPKARLGVGVGLSSLVVAVSSAAGPSIASAILSVAHWQWLFLVNVPLGVLALSIGARTLPVTPESGARLSGLSVLLNALTFGLLISGLAAFKQPGATQRGAAMVALALVAGVLFVRRESRLAKPMLPIDLLRMPVFSLSMATSICSFAAQTMAYIMLPFYFEQTLKLSETQTGFLMTPWPLVTALIAPVAGRLSDRWAPGRISSVGLVVFGCGLAMLCQLGDTATRFDIVWRLAVCGLGFGIFQSPNNRVIIGSAPRHRSGGASGLQAMGRLLGQSSGAVAVSIVFGLVHGRHLTLIAGIGAALALIAACVSSVRRMTEYSDAPQEPQATPTRPVSER